MRRLSQKGPDFSKQLERDHSWIGAQGSESRFMVSPTQALNALSSKKLSHDINFDKTVSRKHNEVFKPSPTSGDLIHIDVKT